MYRSKLLPRIGFALGLLSLPLLTAPSFGADREHSLNVRLSWLTSGYQAAFYLAAAKGWYANAGLDVSLTPGTGSVTTIQLVGSQQYDAAPQSHPHRNRTPASLLLKLFPSVFIQRNGRGNTHVRVSSS